MGEQVVHAPRLGSMKLQIGDEPLPALDSAHAESLLPLFCSIERRRSRGSAWLSCCGRQALPVADRIVDVGPRTLQWRADAPVWLDVEQFERALAEGSLEDAVALSAGELPEATGSSRSVSVSLGFTWRPSRIWRALHQIELHRLGRPRRRRWPRRSAEHLWPTPSSSACSRAVRATRCSSSGRCGPMRPQPR
jgi:hypothetical protein